jgi:hypothetical protein
MSSMFWTIRTLRARSTIAVMRPASWTHRRKGWILSQVGLFDPNYPQVREYLGEAYVIKNNYELAREQLSAIESSALRTVSITGI